MDSPTSNRARPPVGAGHPEVDWRVGRAVVVVFAVSISVAGILWGVAYLALGVPAASAYPFGFALITGLNGWLFRSTRDLTLAAWIEVVAILIVPLLLAIHLGGFAESGAIPLWASLAPIGAMLFLGPVASLVALGGFGAVTTIAVLADAWPSVESLPVAATDVFTIVNVIAVTTVAAASTFRFTSTHAAMRDQQLKVRELEQAYLSQEVLLRQQERLANLGALSAGVAHELNNPSAAIARASEQLAATIDRMDDEAKGALQAGVDVHVAQTVDAAEPGLDVDPLDLGDRTDAVADWLAMHGSTIDWDVAEELAEAGFDDVALARSAERFGPAPTLAAVTRLARRRRARRLADDVRRSAERISAVVGALKGYSHMDGAAEHEVDVVAGLEDTLVVLQHRLRGVTVERAFADDVGSVVGNAGELNQVWTNLIENAADAMDGEGTLTLRVGSSEAGLRIEVEDDGPGIPADLLERVFDPFVTTKPPGQGTGLGLHRAYRTVTERYGGTLHASSEPGRTCFAVVLPPAGHRPNAPAGG